MSNDHKAAEALRIASELDRGMIFGYLHIAEVLRDYAALLREVDAENAKAREIIDQLCACHDEPECPAVAVAREWLSGVSMRKEQNT